MPQSLVKIEPQDSIAGGALGLSEGPPAEESPNWRKGKCEARRRSQNDKKFRFVRPKKGPFFEARFGFNVPLVRKQ